MNWRIVDLNRYFVLSSVYLVCTQTILLAQEYEKSSERLTKLPEKYSYQTVKFEPPLLPQENSEKQLSELKRIQNEQWNQISSIKTKHWFHLIDTKSDRDTLALCKTTFFKPGRLLSYRWYPHKKDQNNDVFIADPQQLQLVQIFLSTPEFQVMADGFRYKGIDMARISLPSKNHWAESELPQNLIPGSDSPDAFFNKVMRILKEQSEFNRVLISRNDSLMEIRIWSANKNEEDCIRWIFDLSKNGVSVYHENLLGGAGEHLIMRNQLQKFGNLWLPTKTTVHRFIRKADLENGKTQVDSWLEQEEHNFFEINCNGKIEAGDFDFTKLPIDKAVPVIDDRTGRNQTRAFGTFLEAKGNN